MALNVEIRTIDGLQVRTQQLPAMRSFALFVKLGKIIGPALTKAADLKNLSLDMDFKELAPIIGEFFSQIKPGEAEVLAQEILVGTVVVLDGSNEELINVGAIDKVFTGRFLTFMKVMAFALQVNFQDFTNVVPGMASPSENGDQEKESPQPS